MATQPLVSIIVPAFNSERTIAETLESAATQSWRNVEIVIVDDGSTDRTAQVAQHFCRREPRARLISQANSGVAAARNRGLSEASGRWIAPLDADDLWHPLKIERQVAAALANPRSGLVYNWSRLIDAEGRVTGDARTHIAQGDVLLQHLRCNFVGNGSTPLIERELLTGRAYDSRVDGCADYLLQLCLAARTQFACVPAFLTGYRVTQANMSADAVRMMRDHIRLYELLRPELPKDIRGVTSQEIARWQTRLALVLLRRGNVAAGFTKLVGALGRRPAIAVAESLELLSTLKRPCAARNGQRSFYDFDPDASYAERCARAATTTG